MQGAIFGGAGPRTQIPNLLNEYRAGKLNLADLVTTRYTLDQVNEAYDDMLNGKNIRTALADAQRLLEQRARGAARLRG